MKNYIALSLLVTLVLFTACKTDDNDGQNTNEAPQLIFKFDFNETQERLNNFGLPAAIPAGHAAQTPDFKGISAHYLELAPTMFTLLGQGEILYQGTETNAGGAMAVDFSQAKVVDEGETFISVPLKDIAQGDYEWIRLSLTYQNYDINLSGLGYDVTGNLTSFVGYNTYINNHTVGGENITVNDDKLQGYWAFKIQDGQLPINVEAFSGESAATTVPNPIASTSPVPAGSCVVTGQIENGLTITGNETEDVVVTLSVSINNSFEWVDPNNNGKFEPTEGEIPVDMGLRGLQVFVD